MDVGQDWRSAPNRPALAPLLVFGLVFWAACASAYSAARLEDVQTCFDKGLVLLAVSLLTLGAFVLFNGRFHGFIKTVALCAIAIALGFSAGSLQGWSIHGEAQRIADAFEGEAYVVLESDSVESNGSERALARIEQSGAPMLVTLYVSSGGPWYRGDRLFVKASLREARFETGDYAWNRASVASLYASSARQLEGGGPLSSLRAVRKSAIEALASDMVERTVLQAVICGYRRNLDGSAVYADYQSSGVAHMIAVSGAHLAIVIGLVASLLEALGVRRCIRILIVSTFSVAYLVIAGVPVSGLRACVMALIGMASYYGRRRASSANALGLGVIALVAFDPCVSVSVSFALSCLSTTGIVMFSPLVAHWLGRTVLGKSQFVVDALAVTLSAGTLSQLYATSVFGVLPLVSPLSNVLCAPLFPIVCGMGLLSSVVACVGLPASEVFVACAAMTVSVLDAVVSALAQVPFGRIPFSIGSTEALVVSFALAGLLWCAWLRARPRFIIAAGCAIALSFSVLVAIDAQADEIVMLDVGQGDAFLLRSRGDALLVDTGNQDGKLVSALARHHVVHLGSVLVTHADDDHCGSLDALARCVGVDRVLVARDMLACEDEACKRLVEQSEALAPTIEGLAVGDSFSVGSFSCLVVWPETFSDAGGNADSVCLYVSYDGDGDGAADATALFTGDAEKDEIGQVLERRRIANVDILKVGHHGSRNGLTHDEVAQLDPTISLIGVGAGNRSGHPHAEKLALLSEAGSSVYRTDLDGDVTCRLRPSGVAVSTLQ